jgi:hypothetical protein
MGLNKFDENRQFSPPQLSPCRDECAVLSFQTFNVLMGGQNEHYGGI